MHRVAGNEVKISIVQHPPVYMNLPCSLDKASLLIREASSSGSRIVVFPETWLPGYPVWLDSSPDVALWGSKPTKKLYRILVNNAIRIPGPHFDRLRKMAGENEVYLVIGCHELVGNTLFNTMLYFHPDGASFSLHRKLMPTFTERLIWGMGDGSTLSAIETEFGTVGGLICWEHWMPFARAVMHDMNEVLHVAQWPAVNDLHQVASRHYAFEGQCFVAAAGTVLTKGDVLSGFDTLENPDPCAREVLEKIPGKDDALLQNGGSAFIRPDSTYLSEPLFGQCAVVTVSFDPEETMEGHLLMDTKGHYSRPDIFELRVNKNNQRNVLFTDH